VIALIDLWGRRLVAWPMVLVGLLLTSIAAVLILAGAWIVNVNLESDDPGES